MSSHIPNVRAGWQDLYVAAILETDNSKLQEKVAAAEHAIDACMEEAADDQLASEERVALLHARSALNILRKERLNG